MTAKLVEGVDFYREGDKVVLKAAYHLKRGYCCNSRCRHCPYKAGAPKPTIELLGLEIPAGSNERGT